MTARDGFGLFVRIVAFLIMLYGSYNILYAVTQVVGFVTTPQAYPTWQHVVGGLVFIGFGAIITRLADWITAFAYPSKLDRGE